MIESQERERQRIAAELHDSLGQHLIVITNRAVLGSTNSTEGMKVQLAEISASASQSIDEVKQIAYNLRPYHLDRLVRVPKILTTSFPEILATYR